MGRTRQGRENSQHSMLMSCLLLWAARLSPSGTIWRTLEKAHQKCSTRGWRLWQFTIDPILHSMNMAPWGVNCLALSSYLNLTKISSTALEKAKSCFHTCFLKDAHKVYKLTTKGAVKSSAWRGCDIGHHKRPLQMLNKNINEVHPAGCPHPLKS